MQRPADEDRVAIVGVERGPQGARLVAIDESGDRRFELVQPAAVADGSLVRDQSPAVSPNRRWLVFASTRERARDETSLWIAPLRPDAHAVRMTSGPSIEAHPAWTHDGSAIVFASTRDGGDFDLWRIAIDQRGQPVGEPQQLTRADGHEVMPTVASDGTILYAAARPVGDREVESRIEAVAPDGSVHVLTSGPNDSYPALSPDGRTIAFARAQRRDDGTSDGELVVVSAAARPEVRGGDVERARELDVRRVVDLPLTDESGPAWSRDGQFLFATSVYRGDDGRPLFSSIVHVDLREREPRRARILRDRAGPIVRLAPAIVAPALDAAALRRDPEYLSELARIMAAAITNARRQSSQPSP